MKRILLGTVVTLFLAATITRSAATQPQTAPPAVVGLAMCAIIIVGGPYV